MTFPAPFGADWLPWARLMAVQAGRLEDDVKRGLTIGRVATSGDYTMRDQDTYVGVTSTAAARAITLPKAGPVKRIVIVKDESGAAGTNNITLSRTSTDLIDGATTSVISTNYGVRVLASDGSAGWWKIV